MKYLSYIILFTSSIAFANDCAKDTKTFCGGVEPGKGQIAKCLEDYSDRLSPACAQELKNFKTKTLKKNPCFEDLANFCGDIPSEARTLEYCLLKNENRLSSVCSNDFKKKKSTILVKNVCAQDIVNVCYSNISGPAGSINHCLMKKRAQLSPFCQKSIDQKMIAIRKNNPCIDESLKHCPEQIAFVDVQECLEKKVSTLNPACQIIVKKETEKAKANPCYKDLTRHCRPRLNPQEQHHCLTLNEKDLSRACLDHRTKQDQRIKKMVTVCETDRLKLCPKAPYQNGMIAKCLRQNKAKVSKACADLL